MLPIYAMLANADLLNSTQCGKELKDFREAIDQKILWALKVLDASGEPMSGFVYGNNYWLGSRSQCEDANNKSPFLLTETELRNNSRYRRIEDEFPPYEVKYFVANFRHNSTLQYHIVLQGEDLITLGMCLPASCLKDQLSILLETVFRNRILLIGQLYSADFTLVEVKDLIDDHQWSLNETFITMTIIVVLTFLLMIIGTAYDVLIYQRRLKKYYKYFQTNANINPLAIDKEQTLHEDIQNEMEKLRSLNFVCKVFQAFSVYSNSKIIFSHKTGENSVLIIHGLRFIMIGWTILAHTIFFTKEYFDNKPTAWRKSEGFFAQLITNAPISVDTFFFLGGFLLAYVYLKNEIGGKDKRKPYNYLNTIKLYFLILLKRFLRLTPTYMIVIGLLEINATWYSKISVFYMIERPHETCSKYWWRNLLYIQNLFNSQEMCMSWSWYLADDMQFFVISSFLLLLSSMYFKVAASLLGLLFMSSMILTGYIAYINDYIPTLDKQYNFIDELYFPPWVRIGPYLVGVITGYILVKLKNKLNFKKKTLILFWILGSSCSLLALFGIYRRRISILAATFYAALGRTIWAIGIAWLVIACSTNNGGILNRILSFKVWIPLSRLTYTVYLINPILITSIQLFSETSRHIDFLINVCILFYFYYTDRFIFNGINYNHFFLFYFSGGVISRIHLLSYICSYVLSLMFETPYMILYGQHKLHRDPN
ncbi:PREDICTED: LOW QUALITY PROTEIN: nose resistant to fluoxetine protein 6-like [Polistes canadensis]|uniref:LOW QUALITY PROTEIN: nose resistant to fluoxetine protein 6-like n=1 Tax=Polistes canadensis TaxID=91411 RepID=UPI000718E934|nr:PREDICTED: LOW QUALITY PROTEIN: nose resistant to fluoxetine protein 6-like [Polistes canadensis]